MVIEDDIVKVDLPEVLKAPLTACAENNPWSGPHLAPPMRNLKTLTPCPSSVELVSAWRQSNEDPRRRSARQFQDTLVG